MKDYIVVGLGFAGISFTHLLEQNNKSFVVFDKGAETSTLTAGALFNPVVLKRFTSVWKAKEQMELLRSFYSEIEQKIGERIVHQLVVYRKLTSLEEQNNWFIACDKPVLSEYLSTKIQKQINENISSDFGFGQVKYTGRIDTKKMVQLYTDLLEQNQLLFREKFEYSSLKILPEGVEYKGIFAKKIVFCEGYNMVNNPFFNYLPMDGCKGELLTFKSEELKLDAVVKSSGFIIPFGENIYKIGTTYDRDDKTTVTTHHAREELIGKLKKLINCKFDIIEQEVGIRPTINDRRPLVGGHPKHNSLFILNGLGTRGAMLAPYVATSLFDLIEKNIPVEKEMDIRRYQKRYKSEV